MMSVEQQAKALADWLAKNPGVEPPEGVDSDVIEAVYSLRPDLAPAPRVSIDDILGLVSTGPLAAPMPPVVATESSPAAPVVVSSVPAAITTPIPANNNRRLWAVLGGVAALAAAVLVTVQVSMTASQGSFAPENSAPTLAQAPAMDQAPGAARQQDNAEGEAAVVEHSTTLDADGYFDAVADLGVTEEPDDEMTFEFANDGDLSGVFQDEMDRDSRRDGLALRELNDGLSRNALAEPDVATGATAAVADVSSRGLLGGELGGDQAAFGVGGMDANEFEVAVRPRPVVAPSPGPMPAAVASPARVATTTTAPSPPPPPMEPEPEPVDLGWNDDFLDAAVVDAEDVGEEELLEEAQTRSVDEGAGGSYEQEEVAVLESVSVSRTRGGRDRGRDQRREERRGQPASAPAGAEAPPVVDMPQEAQVWAEQQVSPADTEPSVESESPVAGRFYGADSNVDAGVIQAQQRARALANRQQYGSAFDTLSGYISPSVPVDIVLDATEYAFAAGRWADTVRVASIRLDANVPSDSAQSRSRLYDYQARAQAMLDQRMSAPSMMSDEP